jgi:hypothetical protein
VRLHFERSTSDWVFMLITAGGIVAAIGVTLWMRRHPLVFPPRPPRPVPTP